MKQKKKCNDGIRILKNLKSRVVKQQYTCSCCEVKKDYQLPRQCPKCCETLAGL